MSKFFAKRPIMWSRFASKTCDPIFLHWNKSNANLWWTPHVLGQCKEKKGSSFLFKIFLVTRWPEKTTHPLPLPLDLHKLTITELLLLLELGSMWSIAWLHISRGADFPKGGFSKILRQNLQTKKWLLMLQKKLKKEALSRVALAAAACIQHTLLQCSLCSASLCVCSLVGSRSPVGR